MYMYIGNILDTFFSAFIYFLEFIDDLILYISF